MIIGIMLLGIGVCIVLAQLFGWDFMNLLFTYWPCLLIIYGGIRLFTRKHSQNFSSFLIALGALVQASKLNWIRGSLIWILIGIVLILIGLRMIVDRYQKRKEWSSSASISGDADNHGTQYFEERDMINDRFLFDKTVRVYRSDSFSGGDIDVLFSTVTINLKNVLPLDKEVRISCGIQFGELTLEVPADWHVIVNGKHYYSSEEARQTIDAATTLLVDSETFAGTLKII
ncbi:LiaF transmembrane domain-containing protein [Levyella massiliensis]|uniref:LiaF transmembrane domain-containing protein n=1 Tax=Levyella massiliensis TaxID=938289 RepID=UPI0023F11CD3|nr:hypothetical protein [Levyella massiliensis]